VKEAFVVNVLERCMRLSYREKIHEAIQHPQLQALLPNSPTFVFEQGETISE
jgi:hypothetical protein